MGYVGSDLACETVPQEGVAGCETSERCVGNFRILRMRILTESAERTLGRARGRYVSVDCGRIDRMDSESERMLVHLLAGEDRKSVV